MNFIPPQDETRLRAAASGVLPNGKAVVVNADGTVSVVSTTPQNFGSEAVFKSGDISNANIKRIAFDSSSNKIIIGYRDDQNSNYATAVVGTISGTSISFGTPAVIANEQPADISAVYDSNANKTVFFYRNGGNAAGRAVVGTVSGTNISFGTAVTVASNVTQPTATFDSNANKIVVAYRDGDNSNYGTARVGTVSGTDISFGTAAVYHSSSSQYNSSTFDSNSNKVVIAFRDGGDSDKGKAVVSTVSGTNISFGTVVEYNGGVTTYVDCAFDSNSNKVVIVYRDEGSSNRGTAIVGTVSETSISFGSEVVFEDAAAQWLSVTFDSNVNKIVVAYKESENNSYGMLALGTVSGASISFASSVSFNQADTIYIGCVFDSNVNKTAIAYVDVGNSSYGTALVFTPTSTNLTAENYIGMSGGAVTFVNQAVGSPQVFESANSRYISSAFDSSNNKIVITYGHDVDGSKSGKAVVGTVTDNSISFGTPVVFESAEVKYTSVVFDSSNNKFVIAYEDDDNSDYGTAIVGTVSGTTISFGSPVVFESAAVLYVTSTFDTNSNKVVIAYTDDGNSSHGTAIVGTVSGTNISFGSATVFNSGATSFSSASFDSSNNKAVISYCDQGNSSYGTAIVGTVSGTSISFGSEAVFEAAEAQQIGSTFDSSSNKIVVAYQDNGNSGYGNAVVGTVSGTGISFGTAVIFETARSNNSSVTFDTSSNKVVIAYQDAGNSNYGTFISGTVSGTSISFDTATVFEAANSDTFGATFDSNSNKVVIAYRDTGNSNYGTGIVVQTESTNRGQVASGSSASVDIIGTVSENQNELTAGQSYFVQTDGTIGLTADDPSVFAGTAISATKLLVKT